MSDIEATVQSRTRVIRDSITRPANTTAYATGDVVSEDTTNDHFVFGVAGDSSLDRTKVSRLGVGTSVLNRVILYSSANVTTKFASELWLFTADIANVADNSAFAPSDAEVLTLAGIVDLPLANWRVGNATSGAGGNAVCIVDRLSLPLRTASTGILYGQLVTRGAYTPVSGEVFTIDLVLAQD